MANWQCHNQRVDVFLEQIIQKSVAYQHVPMRMASLGTELCQSSVFGKPRYDIILLLNHIVIYP